MTSSPPITKSEDRSPPVRDSRWRQWLESVVAGAVISALVIALVSVGAAGLQSLKGDTRDVEARLSDDIIATEARLTEKIEAARMDVIATETRLSTAIAASEARQRQDLKDFKADVKAGNRALNEKLDRVLERLPVPKV